MVIRDTGRSRARDPQPQFRKGRSVGIANLLVGDVKITRNDRDITIADLTGIAAEDLAIAELFAKRLGDRQRSSAGPPESDL